jgi:phosphoesterase RecJ-like protein
MQKLEGLKAFLASPKRIIITTHHKPDADALGSSLSLWGYLRKKGHDVTVLSPSDYPNFLTWMTGNSEVIIYEGNESRSAEMIANADLIACLDFSAISRINQMGPLVLASPAKKLMIDHHPQPEDFAEFVLHDTLAASSCELIYRLIHIMDDDTLLDEKIGECLYAGIMTDTGSFKHPNVTRDVHTITAHLIDLGVNTHKVAKAVYDTNTLERLRLLGYALSEKLVVLPEYKTAYITITQDELIRFNSKTGDTEGLVNYALSLEGVVMAALIVDRKVLIKMSFRSVGDFSVNDFARNYFEGGGHKNAAGGQSNQSLEETVKRFLDALVDVKEQLQNN